MVLVGCKQSGLTGSPKKTKKVAPPKQDIALFLRSSITTVAFLKQMTFF